MAERLMAEPARKRWTLDAFLAFDDGTDTRYELIGGEVVAMALATWAHVVLAGRLASQLCLPIRTWPSTLVYHG